MVVDTWGESTIEMPKKNSKASPTATNQLLPAVNNLLQRLNTTGSSKINNNNGRRNKGRFVRRLRARRPMPVLAWPGRPRNFSVSTRYTRTSMVVSGRDLVYKIPSNLETAQTSIALITANPLYWVGTRIANIARGYQNFRPLKFRIEYIPQVAVTQEGNVIYGTLWDQPPPFAELQQTLRTSNGGNVTQAARLSSSVVRLGSNLQQNLYSTFGALTPSSNPFNVLALTNIDKVPGWFYISYTYLFKNPVANSSAVYNSGIENINEMKSNYTNDAIVLTTNTKVTMNNKTTYLAPGTVLQKENGTLYYNGQEIVIDEEGNDFQPQGLQLANGSITESDVEPTDFTVQVSGWYVDSGTDIPIPPGVTLRLIPIYRESRLEPGSSIEMYTNNTSLVVIYTSSVNVLYSYSQFEIPGINFAQDLVQNSVITRTNITNWGEIRFPIMNEPGALTRLTGYVPDIGKEYVLVVTEPPSPPTTSVTVDQSLYSAFVPGWHLGDVMWNSRATGYNVTFTRNQTLFVFSSFVYQINETTTSGNIAAFSEFTLAKYTGTANVNYNITVPAGGLYLLISNGDLDHYPIYHFATYNYTGSGSETFQVEVYAFQGRYQFLVYIDNKVSV